MSEHSEGPSSTAVLEAPQRSTYVSDMQDVERRMDILGNGRNKEEQVVLAVDTSPEATQASIARTQEAIDRLGAHMAGFADRAIKPDDSRFQEVAAELQRSSGLPEGLTGVDRGTFIQATSKQELPIPAFASSRDVADMERFVQVAENPTVPNLEPIPPTTAEPSYSGFTPRVEDMQQAAELVAAHAPGPVARKFFGTSEKGIGGWFGEKLYFLEDVRDKVVTSVKNLFRPKIPPPKPA